AVVAAHDPLEGRLVALGGARREGGVGNVGRLLLAEGCFHVHRGIRCRAPSPRFKDLTGGPAASAGTPSPWSPAPLRSGSRRGRRTAWRSRTPATGQVRCPGRHPWW